MASTMRATTIKVSAAQRASVRPAKVAVSASLRTEVAKVAKAAGVSVASMALALSANAATIKIGADNGARLCQCRTVLLQVEAANDVLISAQRGWCGAS